MSLHPDFNPPRDFSTRIADLTRTHASMSHGYDAKADSSGLIIFRPRRQRTRLPWRQLVISVMALASLKLLVLTLIGELTYQDSINTLASGNAIERAGAWIMQIDPVTRSVASQLAALLQG